MDARKNVRVTMLTAVDELFKTDHKAYQYAPALADDIGDLRLVVTTLDGSLGIAELSTADMTKAKQSLKTRVVATGKRLIGVGKAHAAHKKDTQLTDQFDQFNRQLNKAKDTELPLVCTNLSTTIKTINAEDLAKRNVSAADIATFEALVAQFKGDVPKTQNARGETSTHVNKSEALTVEGCSIVADRIAPTMFNIKEDVPAFYARFVTASTIRKPASSSSQLNVIAVNDVTGETVEGVLLRNIEILSEAKITTKKRKVKAKSAKKAPKLNLKADMVEVVRDGYHVHQLPMPTLKRGKTTTVTVRLTPIKAA